MGVDPTREPTAREARLTAISLVLMFFGMLLSHKVAGRLAISNIAQILALLMLFRAFPRALRARDLGWLLLAIAAVVVAALSVYSTYGYEIQPQHTAFFFVSALYLLVWYRATQAADLRPTADQTLRRLVLPMFAYLGFHTALDVGAGEPMTDMGFDDKSHAAVAASFFAFIVLRVWNGPLKLPIAAGFVAMALLTASRLPVIMLPFFVIAFAIEYRRERRRAQYAWQVYLCHATVAVGAGVGALLIRANLDVFHVLTRLGPDAASSAQSSTRAHLLLIWYGLQIKFDNAMNFFFGVTPGGYAGTVYRSSIDISELRQGWGLGAMAAGTAPMHSAHTSIFTEFPFPVFLLYAVLLAWLCVRLLRAREFTVLLGHLGFVSATLFYSSHNEAFFYAVLAYLIVVVHGRQVTRAAARGSSSNARGSPLARPLGPRRNAPV